MLNGEGMGKGENWSINTLIYSSLSKGSNSLKTMSIHPS
jgi:hypothetical protein